MNPLCITSDDAGSAVLFFARHAASDARNKPVSGRSFQQGKTLYSLLNKHVSERLKDANLPVIHSAELALDHHNFAGNFLDAIEAVFARGYSRVIAVGNDSPEINAGLIKEAHRHLQDHKAVVGRAADGGAFLIAVDQSHFNRKRWEALPWQSPRLSQSLINVFRPQQVYLLAPVLEDLDSKADWLHWMGGSGLTLARIIRAAWNGGHTKTAYRLPAVLDTLIVTSQGRSPPAVAALFL